MDIYNKFTQNKSLCFSLKSECHRLNIIVELRLKNQDVQYHIQTSREWEDYSISLREFGGADTEWHVLKEVKFLIFKNDILKDTIEVRGIKII